MELITSNLNDHIRMELKDVNSSIFIVSPYIRSELVEILLEGIKGKDLDLKCLTNKPGVEYVSGQSDYEAVKRLNEAGFEMNMLSNLSVCLILFDKERLFIGASHRDIVELDSIAQGMKLQDVDLDQVRKIMDHFWDNPYVVPFANYQELEDEIKTLQEKYEFLKGQLASAAIDFSYLLKPMPYESFLSILREKRIAQSYEHIEDDAAQNVFKLNDKYLVKISKFKEEKINEETGGRLFIYQLSEGTATLIKKRKIHGLILTMEEPDTFVCLPTAFVTDKLLKRSLQGEDNKWTIEIERQEEELSLSISGKLSEKNYPIKQYEGDLHFRIKGLKV